MRQRKRDILSAKSGSNGRRFAMKLNGRTLPFRAHNFDVSPAHAAAPTRTERFHPRLLGGETSGIAFKTARSPFAVAYFALGVDQFQKEFSKSFNRFANASYFRDVDASAKNHRNTLLIRDL